MQVGTQPATVACHFHPLCSHFSQLVGSSREEFQSKTSAQYPIMRDVAHTHSSFCSYLSHERAVSRLVSHSTRSNFLFDQSLILTYDSDIKILLLAPVLLLVRHESFSFSVCRVTPLGSGAFGLVITTLAFYLARNMTDGGCVGCGE